MSLYITNPSRCWYIIAWPCCVLLLLVLMSSSAMAVGLQVRVTGIEDEQRNNVEQYLSINKLTADVTIVDKLKRKPPAELDERSISRLPRLHRVADQEISAALQPFGYYTPKIQSSLELIDDVWQASYNIDVGKPVKFSQVSVQIKGDGKDDQLISDALKKIPLQAGVQLQHSLYEQTKSTLLNVAIREGFLDSRYLTSELLIDPEQLSAAVSLELETGSKYYFGEVSFDQEAIDPDLIESYIPFKAGDKFESGKLVNLQLSLSDSRYFDNVEIEADRSAAVDYAIPITINATPSKKRQYMFAFGYGTDTGPRVKFGTEFRRINRRGHRLSTDILLSSIKKTASANYVIPLGEAGSDSLRFLARVGDEEVGDGRTKRLTLGTSYNDTWRKLQRRLYLNYATEEYTIGDSTTNIVYFTPGVSLSFAKVDNVIFPKSGYSWTVDAHGASSEVLSDATFVQASGALQTVWSPGEKSRVLTKVHLGATSIDNFDLLPTTSRFYAGGDKSVRGYSYQSIGATDDEGNVIGGQYLASFSLETDYLFYKSFGAAVFADMGDASLTSSFDFKRSVGAGLRWQSPVGMLRIDVATPLDEDATAYRIHISIGADL